MIGNGLVLTIEKVPLFFLCDPLMLLVYTDFFWWPWWLRIGKAARFEQQVGSDPKGGGGRLQVY